MLNKAKMEKLIAIISVIWLIVAATLCYQHKQGEVGKAVATLQTVRAGKANTFNLLVDRELNQNDINQYLTNHSGIPYETFEVYVMEYYEDRCRLKSRSIFRGYRTFSTFSCPESITSLDSFFPRAGAARELEATYDHKLSEVGKIHIIDDYRGVQVYSTSQPITLNGEILALAAEVDYFEVMKPVYKYWLFAFIATTSIIVITVLLGHYIVDQQLETQKAIESKRQQEKETAMVNAVLQAGFAASLEGLSVFDKDFVCVQSNAAFEELNGVDNPKGKPIIDLVPECVRELHKDKDFLRENAHKVDKIHGREISIDKTGRTTGLHISKFFVDNKRFWFVSQPDYTEKKAIEAQAKQLREGFMKHQEQMLEIKQAANV